VEGTFRGLSSMGEELGEVEVDWYHVDDGWIDVTDVDIGS
jgi:hypothetical protein